MSLLLSVLIALGFVCSSAAKIVSRATLPHDRDCFTQGLYLDGDVLYESCGRYGRSSLRIANPKTGDIIKQTSIERKVFAEGIVVHDGRVYMLTWKNKFMMVFDATSLELIQKISITTYNGEGWGFTKDDNYFIASDGSDRLTYFAPPSHATSGHNTADSSGTNNAIKKADNKMVKVKELVVRDKDPTKPPVAHINELQYANGYIYANIWYKDIIIKIDPATGFIVETFDLSALYPHAQRIPTADCLNGIAFNGSDGSFILTGKLWPQYHQVLLNSESNNDMSSAAAGLQQARKQDL